MNKKLFTLLSTAVVFFLASCSCSNTNKKTSESDSIESHQSESSVISEVISEEESETELVSEESAIESEEPIESETELASEESEESIESEKPVESEETELISEKSEESIESEKPVESEETELISEESEESIESETGPIIPDYENGNPKALKGTGTIFNEVLGYNTKDAAIIEEDGVRYVTYASNETEKGEQVFAARKATKIGGKWVYEEKHIVMRGVANSWDKYIYNPTVIKGAFNYLDTQYEYLLAYNGNNNKSGVDNHIGIAVSNDLLGEWVRVGDEPIIKNPEIYEAAYGFGCPSLVSYDHLGKGYLFFAAGDTDVSYTAVKTFDFSDLDHMVLEGGYASLPITGLSDKVAGEAIITNAGFALSKDGQSLMMVRDRLPGSLNQPGQTNEVEIVKADIEIISDLSLGWTNIENINGMKTIDMEDDESMGWDQIYSGEFVTDPYGQLISDDYAEVLYSTYDEECDAPSYSSTLAIYEVLL